MSPVIDYPPCRRDEGIPPPSCCQWPLDERIARLERAQVQIDAVTPKRCPSCGSAAMPLFWVDCDVFDCINTQCHAIFSGRGD